MTVEDCDVGPLRRALWINDAEARLGNAYLSVAYKHQLDRVLVNPGEVSVFFQYHARDGKRDRAGTASEWGEDFKLRVERFGKLVIAEPEWNGGRLVDAECVDCWGGSLLIEVRPDPSELIKIGHDPERPFRGWLPEGYSNPDHLWNHPDLRRR